MTLRPTSPIEDSFFSSLIIGLPSTLGILAIFLIPHVWGENFGLVAVGVYWVLVLGSSLLYGIPKYLRLRRKLSDEERRRFWSDSKGASLWWAIMTLFVSWTVAIASVLWMNGFTEPFSWYVYLLVASSWIWPFVVFRYV